MSTGDPFKIVPHDPEGALDWWQGIEDMAYCLDDKASEAFHETVSDFFGNTPSQIRKARMRTSGALRRCI